VEQAGGEVSVEAALVRAGWEVPVPALDLVENASALIAGHAYRTKWAYPAIAKVVQNAEQRW